MTKHNNVTPVKKPVAVPAAVMSPEHPHWKKVFYALLLIFAIITFVGGFNVGFHSDEMDMNAYGKANWKYLATHGKDTSYMQVKLDNGTAVSPVIKTYGGFFEFINNCVVRSVGPFYGGEYNTRHMLCQIMGLLAIWIAGLISVSLTGRYLFGVCCILLLFLSPTYFGHMLFNTKDIPFTLGYTLSIYGMILLVKQKHAFRVRPFIYISLGLAACIGTRIGGLVLLGYLALAVAIIVYDRWKKKGASTTVFRKQVIALTLSIAVGFTLAILPWPFALSSPMKNLQYALEVATKFPQRIPFVFEGTLIDSLTIPPHYLSKWMSITIPVFVIILFFLSIIALVLNFRKREARYYAFVLLAVIFPIVYAIQTKAALYSGWRHLLFIYPLFVVFAVYMLQFIARAWKKSFVPYVLAGSCVIGMLHPIYWSIRNHPYEYTYFNETSGGFAENYHLYETDYWQLATRQALDWLYKHEHIDPKKKMQIGSNSYAVTDYLVHHDLGDTGTKVNLTSYKAKAIVDWDYLILSNLFLDPYVIENEFYPPKNAIYKIEIDGKTICAIVKDTTRDDYNAFLSITKHQLDRADSLADLYLSRDPNCVKIMEVSASAKAEKSDWKACYSRCATGLQFEPNNLVLRYYLGIYYANNGEPAGAIRNIEGALALGYEKSKGVYHLLSGLHAQVGDQEKAKYYAALAK